MIIYNFFTGHFTKGSQEQFLVKSMVKKYFNLPEKLSCAVAFEKQKLCRVRCDVI